MTELYFDEMTGKLNPPAWFRDGYEVAELTLQPASHVLRVVACCVGKAETLTDDERYSCFVLLTNCIEEDMDYSSPRQNPINGVEQRTAEERERDRDAAIKKQVVEQQLREAEDERRRLEAEARTRDKLAEERKRIAALKANPAARPK